MSTHPIGAEMLKGHLEMLVLSALERAPAHGYAILAALAQRSRGVFDLPEGTVYPALHRMEQAGLLQSKWNEVEGRRRRVYSLSAAGRSALQGRLKTWRAFAKAVEASIAASAHAHD